jgi:8-oxo-dGTP pyrophosphatase MutT (NUDIX family)
MTSPPIRPASTLVLARDHPSGPELFLSKRTPRAAFMASASVYPGGRVDDEDADAGWRAHLSQTDEAWFVDAFCGDVAADAARAHHVAAIREAFEEAGVLVATRADGTPLTLEAPRDAERFAEHRAALNRGESAFIDIVGREKLQLDVGALSVFAHWITPPFETRRFDTWFFFARAPRGQEPVPDFAELVEGGWVRPEKALEDYAGGHIALAPPTFCTLRDFSLHYDVSAMERWVRDERPVAIEPRLVEHSGETFLVLPGDPLFPSPACARPPLRFAFANGRLTPVENGAS